MEGLSYLHQSHHAMAAGGQNISGRHNNSNISQQNNLPSRNITKSPTISDKLFRYKDPQFLESRQP